MLEHYLTSSEAAEFVQQTIGQPVGYYDLDNLIRAKHIEAPRLIAGRRMWSADDLRAACHAIRIRRLKRPNHSNGKLRKWKGDRR